MELRAIKNLGETPILLTLLESKKGLGYNVGVSIPNHLDPQHAVYLFPSFVPENTARALYDDDNEVQRRLDDILKVYQH